MNRVMRLAAGLFAMAAGALASPPARAQVACNTLPNPIVVIGAKDFEPVLQRFAVKISAEATPATIIVVAGGGAVNGTSCGGLKAFIDRTDFGGLPGRYYVQDGDDITAKSCILAAGQAADVAISEVFYETCSNVPQPKPAEIVDLLGPVQTMVFVVPAPPFGAYTTFLTYDEARTIYGCGVSSARVVAGALTDPENVFCRDAASGVQLTLARNLGTSESTVLAPGCTWTADDAKLAYSLSKACDPSDLTCVAAPRYALGFVNKNAVDRLINPAALAFQALHQTQAFFPDSSQTATDRRNVRDGHYPLWSYVHLIAKTTSMSPQVSDLIGWITGAKRSPKVEPALIEIGAGLTPQCAMKVRRTSDGGPLSPYSPPQTCTCAFEALSTQTTPAACIPCGSDSACPCGSTCQYGFCE